MFRFLARRTYSGAAATNVAAAALSGSVRAVTPSMTTQRYSELSTAVARAVLPVVGARMPLAAAATTTTHAMLPFAASPLRRLSSTSDRASFNASRAVEDAIAWLSGKVPRGFGRFFPNGGHSDNNNDGADSSSKGAADASKKDGSEDSPASGAKENESRGDAKKSAPNPFAMFGANKGGGDGGSSGGGSSGGQSPSPTQILQSILLTIGASLLLHSVLTGGSNNDGHEISYQEFVNRFLANGLVEKIVVENKTVARVFLRNAGGNSSNDPQQQHQQHQGNFDDANEGGVNPTTGGIATNSAFNAQSGRSQFFFNIGSVDSLERNLFEAQRALGVDPTHFVPVHYATEVKFGEMVGRFLPTLLLIGLWLFMMRGMAGGMGGGAGGGMGGGARNIFGIGKAKVTTLTKEQRVKTTFKDVAGLGEAKVEIMEFVRFLQNPERFTRLGAKLPRGALLAGPPGTGKTLLARATAGEANVPFLSMSGADFVEMFVGVGPSRVRDLFKQARESAPCIVFIDEIDAIARARGRGGFSGGNDERESTLNQLLVEMDGFATSAGVVVFAATNRVDILDPALLRPGRFDRQIQVDLPDIKGRAAIFEVHLKPLRTNESRPELAQRLAALTPGFSGADIGNLCNEAALIAARHGKTAVQLVDFERATDRVLGGLEKKSKVMSLEERRLVAFHEAGHAVAGWFLAHADPLLKVTVVPRGQALGFAQYLPQEVSLYSTEQIKHKICMALGGRAAEQLFFGRVSTGASDDLRRTTGMARALVTDYGMSERLPNLAYPRDPGAQEFYPPYSEATAQLIDEEVRTTIDALYKQTLALLEEHRDRVTALAERLLREETVNHEGLVEVLGPRQFTTPAYEEYVKNAVPKEVFEADDKANKANAEKEAGAAAPAPAM